LYRSQSDWQFVQGSRFYPKSNFKALQLQLINIAGAKNKAFFASWVGLYFFYGLS
jgi:hypothetical protein